MKKLLTTIAVLAILFTAVVPAYAQLGETDISSFTVQNIDTTTATVTITFVEEDGTEHTPTTLNASQTNPFDLDPGESFEIYLPGIPEAQLADGRYSVVIESTARVATIANLIGEGDINFNGSYSGFDAGASPFFLPGVYYAYYGWYSLLSVQNVGSAAADITVSISCVEGATGTLTATGVPMNASVHFDLEETVPTGFTASTVCHGSASITSTQPVVAVDNQTAPAGGNMQSYSGVATGAPTIYIPALYKAYYGWAAALVIRKVDAGSTTVTIEYSDGDTDDTCNLTDAAPSCELYMPSVHGPNGTFGATVTNSAGFDLVAVVNAANADQAQTYNGVLGGSGEVGIPSTMVAYYGWNTSFTCQNVGTVDTTMNIEYDGYASDAYDTASKAPGEQVEIFQPSEDFLPDGHISGATVTANAAGAEIACIVNFNNPDQMATTNGDWSMSYNAFNK